MKVFWSWQSDLPSKVSRSFVKDALTEAVAAVAIDLSLAEADRPEVDHDTKDEPGLVEIVSTIFKKIEGASVFVGDVTPVAKTDKGKLVPNPNVMIELGHALKSLGHEKIILISNAAYGGGPEDLPFDLRHRRGPITFKLRPEDGPSRIASQKGALVAALSDALRSNLGAALAIKDAGATFPLYPAASSDCGTWLAPGEGIEHQSFFQDGGVASTWKVAEGPKAYLRVCPARWSKEKPKRRVIQGAPAEVRVSAEGGYTSGDGGANSFGVVSVGLNGRAPGEVHAVTQWFDKSGEIWGFNSRISGSKDGRSQLSHYFILGFWAKLLRRSVLTLNHFGASVPFRVEAGVTGLDGLHWSSSGSNQALDGAMVHVSQGRDWSSQAQVDFLADAYNILADAFNQPNLTREQARNIIAQTGGV